MRKIREIPDRASKRAEQALTMAEYAVNAGVIYNVDFKEVKEAFNRYLDYLGSSMNDTIHGLTDAEGWDGLSDATNVYQAHPEIADVTFMSNYAHTYKKAVKSIEKVKKLGMFKKNTPEAKLAREYMDLYASKATLFGTLLEQLKGMVVKGRKPSTNPRKTPERTIENTGHCSICGKNVKMKGGKMVAHGYRIRWGYQQGNCFGVGYEPVEVSKRAYKDYIKALETTFDNVKKEYQNVKNMTDEEVNKKYKNKRGRPVGRYYVEQKLESDIRYIERDIKMFKKLEMEWKPNKLPEELIKRSKEEARMK